MAANFNYFQPNQNDTTGALSSNLFNRSITPAQTQTQNNFQVQSFFPQSQGNVFLINSSSELQNIPITNGMSAVICLSENILYLKTFQNNIPAVVAYKLTTFEPQPAQPTPVRQEETSLATVLSQIDERLKKLEENYSSKKSGGNPEWQAQI